MKYLKSYKIFESVHVDKFNINFQPEQAITDIITDIVGDLDEYQVNLCYGEVRKYNSKEILTITITKFSDDGEYAGFCGDDILPDIKEIISQISDKFEFLEYCVTGDRGKWMKGINELSDINYIEEARFDFKRK